MCTSLASIDVAIAREHLTAALAAVAPLGYTIPAAPLTFGAGTANERHVQRVNKIVGAQHLVLDLLIAEAAYAGVLDDRIDVALPAGAVTFVSRDTLLRMKRLAGRPIDLADLEKLEGDDATWAPPRRCRAAAGRPRGALRPRDRRRGTRSTAGKRSPRMRSPARSRSGSRSSARSTS